MNKVRKTTLALSVSTALLMAAAAPIGAQTDLQVANDGLTLTADAISTEDILSTTLRIEGPNDYAFEQRIEDSIIQWVPEANLADGVYYWEAQTVTVQPGAPVRAVDLAPPTVEAPGQQQDLQNGLGTASMEISAESEVRPIPLERMFEAKYKSVNRRSGSFIVKGGVIIPAPETLESIQSDGTDDFGKADEPGIIGSIAGAVLDFVIPTAHAVTNVDNALQIFDESDDDSTQVFWQSNSDSNWWLQNNVGVMKFVEFPTSGPSIQQFAFSADGGAEIGIGTGTPFQPLHIIDDFPRIRLDDANDASSWYLRAQNAGRFEIAESASGTPPFTIDDGAPANAFYIGTSGNIGIGTATPARDLHIDGAFIRVENGFSTWEWNNGSAGLWFSRTAPTVGTGVLRIQNTASSNSLVIDGAGVGIGTGAPADKLHILATDGTAGILLQETQAIATNTMLEMVHNGNPGFQMENTGSGAVWQFRLGGSGASEQFTVSKVGTGQPEAAFLANGNLVIAGSLIEGSSREIKQDIAPVNANDLMARLEALNVHEWSYTRSPGNRHIGPMAEDFYELFGFGQDEKSIFPRDLAGIALVAVKEVHQRNQALEAQNAGLLERLERIEAQLNMD